MIFYGEEGTSRRFHISQGAIIIATFKRAYTPEEVKNLGVTNVRNAYNILAEEYNRIMDRKVLFCSVCGKPQSTNEAFYKDERFISGRFPICKRCLLKMVEQRKNDKDEPNETKESVRHVLRMLDLPYLNDVYENCVKGAQDGVKEKNRHSPFTTYIVMMLSLPQYKDKHWEHSEFEEEYYDFESEDDINENSRIYKQAKKHFGNGYSPQDLIFLENEYQDWIKRYACENKAQEILFKRICFKELEIDKAQKAGRDTKELDKTLQDLMGSMALKPNQNNSNALTEAKTFGQLIQKWENEKPIPEPDEEFRDVNKIGMYLDVFFKGHLARMMGLKNAFSHTYEKFIKKYTVDKPQYDEDTDSETLFDQIFGAGVDEI